MSPKLPPPERSEPVPIPPFPPRQAFVVHFSHDSDASRGRCAGRVEHVVSGRSARFRSSPDLLAFMREVLRSIARAGDDGGAGDEDASRPPTIGDADADTSS